MSPDVTLDLDVQILCRHVDMSPSSGLGDWPNEGGLQLDGSSRIVGIGARLSDRGAVSRKSSRFGHIYIYIYINIYIYIQIYMIYIYI
jgi:hypothetical protein